MKKNPQPLEGDMQLKFPPTPESVPRTRSDSGSVSRFHQGNTWLKLR